MNKKLHLDKETDFAKKEEKANKSVFLNSDIATDDLYFHDENEVTFDNNFDSNDDLREHDEPLILFSDSPKFNYQNDLFFDPLYYNDENTNFNQLSNNNFNGLPQTNENEHLFQDTSDNVNIQDLTLNNTNFHVNESINETTNYIPFLGRNDDKDINESSQNLPRKRSPKKKIPLNNIEQEFKDKYYKHFTNRKKFSKNYVVKIHKLIMGKLNLRPIKRDEVRQIDLYFKNFAQYQTEMFDYFNQNKEEISSVFQ